MYDPLGHHSCGLRGGITCCIFSNISRYNICGKGGVEREMIRPLPWLHRCKDRECLPRISDHLGPGVESVYRVYRGQKGMGEMRRGCFLNLSGC